MIDTERNALKPVLAQNLRLWRVKRNLSQEEAAQRSGLSRDTISRAERGRGIQLRNLERLAVTYGLASVAPFYVPVRPAHNIEDAENPAGTSGVAVGGPMAFLDGAAGGGDVLMVPMFSGLPARLVDSDPSYVGQAPVRMRFGHAGDVVLITINDDSMYPRLERGALLIVNTALTPKSQDNVFCSLPGGACAIRVYRAGKEGGRRVEPANQSWGPPTRLDEGVKIHGVVVGFWFETPAAKRLLK